MVAFKSIILTAALFSGFVSALPTENPSQRPNEIPVKAPDGTPTSDVTEGAKSTSGSNYGSSYDNKGYDNKGYDNKGYDSGNAYTTTSSAMKEESTSSMKEESTSSMMHETMKEESTSTSTTYESKATYGSGSTTWGGSGYDDCVAKCVSTYGAPPGTYKPTATSGYEGSTGSGSTVTVLVAPTQGVLRFVPVAVNASVGTTIKFMWGGGPHTVTKGSALLPCNKTSEAPVFVSGQQNKDFVFTQVVNDTKPTYYFCGVATHCQKGMFGMINPPSAFGAATSVGGMMGQLMANDSNLQAYASYTANNTQGKTGSNWGASINLDGMPEWARGPVAENVLFTRNLLAMNPDIVKEDGSIDMSSITNTPLMIPMDVAAQINAAGAGGAGAAGNNASTPANGPASGTSSSAASQPTNSNGASTMASPKVLVALMAVVATFFAL